MLCFHRWYYTTYFLNHHHWNEDIADKYLKEHCQPRDNEKTVIKNVKWFSSVSNKKKKPSIFDQGVTTVYSVLFMILWMYLTLCSMCKYEPAIVNKWFPAYICIWVYKNE